MRRALALAAMVLASGCGGDPDVVTKQDLEKIVSQQLTANGHPHQRLDCDGDLRAVVTETTRCIMTTGNKRYPVAVFVKAVSDGQATYDLKIGPAMK